MPNLPIAVKVSGSDYVSTEVELQRSNTEVSLIAGELSNNANFGDYDCSTLTGWSQNVTGTADAPSVVTFDSKSCIKLSVPTKTTVGDASNIYRSHSVITAGAVLSVKFYMEGFDTGLTSVSPTTNMCAMYIAQETAAAQYGALLYVTPDGIFNSSGTYKIYDSVISQDAWHELIIKVNLINGHDIYLDGELIIACADLNGSGIGVKFTYIRMFTYGEYAGTLYLDEIKVGDTLNTVYPTSSVVSLPQIDSESNITIWDMSTFSMATNPNGESGTVLFKYAYDNTGETIPDYADDDTAYNDTWLTLAQLKAETDVIDGILRIACQLSGNGSQDATITDASITATMSGSGGGSSKPLVFFTKG